MYPISAAPASPVLIELKSLPTWLGFSVANCAPVAVPPLAVMKARASVPPPSADVRRDTAAPSKHRASRRLFSVGKESSGNQSLPVPPSTPAPGSSLIIAGTKT